MAFKKNGTKLRVSPTSLLKTLKHNRSLKTMEKLDKAINWKRIEEILNSHY